MVQDPPGWERHESKRDGALFLHNPSTGESVWFEGWVEKKSKWYGRNYWFQPTTGRSEWELPVDSSSLPSKSPFVREEIGAAVPDVANPSNEKVKSWMAKIKARKMAQESSGGGHDAQNSRVSHAAGGGVVQWKTYKRKREADEEEKDAPSDDDMDVDDDIDSEGDPPTPPPPSMLSTGMPPAPYHPAQLPPPPPREDVPYVALRRETLREDCLERFAKKNAAIGPMRGLSKTSRTCRDEGMTVGLSGIYSRFLWIQHMRQTMALASGEVRRNSRAPPDPIFPSITDGDDELVRALVEGQRSKVQAERVLEELSDACREAATELETLLEEELPRVKEQVVTLHEETRTATGEIHVRHVTGKGARVPGPNPNTSYSLRYLCSPDSDEREASFAISGMHLEKVWRAYCARTQGIPPPVWDQEFLRRLFCVLSRYETLSATSDGYQMAFPRSGLRVLRELLAVDCECFASPLNCTLEREGLEGPILSPRTWSVEKMSLQSSVLEFALIRDGEHDVRTIRFCSVAYDTDSFFGSEGNFFLSNYQEGSFEANPPFLEEVVERTVDHIHHLLERAVGPLSFAVIVPGRNDVTSYNKMVNSHFTRPEPGFHLTLAKGEHNYRPGMQHRHNIDEKPSTCDTFVFILQNDEGARRWPVSTGGLDNLKRELQMEARRYAE